MMMQFSYYITWEEVGGNFFVIFGCGQKRKMVLAVYKDFKI